MSDVLERYPELANTTPAEKMELIEALWASLSNTTEIPVSPEHQAELQRRLAQIEANPQSALTVEEARSQLRKR